MKIRANYQKTIEDWIDNVEMFPTNFNIQLSKNRKEAESFDILLQKWIIKNVENLKSNDKVRNIRVLDNQICYEKFDEDFLDAEDVFEAETISELVQKMKELECSTFYQDDKGYWTIE
jgi:hypothetical protein